MAVSANSTNAFTEAIKRMASQECKQIDSQTKALRSQKLTEMKKDVRHKYDVSIERELSKIRSDVNRQLALTFESSKKELADLRNSLSDEVFENVQRRIEEFTKTEEYTDFLVKSINALEEELGEDGVVYYLCERDMALKDKITKKLSKNIEFSVDGTILVGGVKAVCEKTQTLADDTLDVRLVNQKEWFREHSGLKT